MTTASQDLNNQCIHELTRRFCALCNGKEDLRRKERDLEVERVLALGEWFPSLYGGNCANCRERFHSGTPIKPAGQFETASGGAYIAMCCAPSEEE